MIAGLQAYPTVKNSGVPWLGEIPEHWDVSRAQNLFREVDRRSQAGVEAHLSMSQHLGLVPSSMLEQRTLVSESYAGGKLCEPDDLVLNRLKAHLGVFARAGQAGVISPDYTVLRPRCPLEVRYFEELLRSPACRSELRIRAKGIVEGFWRLYTDDFYNIRLPVPPRDEQAAIVRFLDHADRRIRRYIRAKQKLVKLLADRRQALTHDALRAPRTRSLRICSAADTVERPIDRQDNEVYTPIGLYNRGRGIFHKTPTRGSKLGDSNFFWVAEGDLVLSGQFAWEGAIALAGQEDDRCVASHRYPILRGKPEVAESAYLLSFFQTGWGQLLLDHHSRGAAGRNRPLNAVSLLKESVPIPPLPIQKEIAAVVHLESRLNWAVAGLMSLLREYRARLFSDVVTGKRDVRTAAAQLPDEGQELEPLYVEETLADAGDGLDNDLGATAEEVEV